MNDKISNQLSFSSNTVNSRTTVNPPINVVSNPYAAQVATMTNNSNNNENNTTYETMEYAQNLLNATTIHQFPNYNPSTTEIQPNQKQAIADSGCTDDMCAQQEIFEDIFPLHGSHSVTLGDDKTKLPIKGYGMMNYLLAGQRIRRPGLYVPDLGTTLLSIKQHMQYKGCYFLAQNNTVILAFPDTMVYPNTDTEFTLDISPAKNLSTLYAFNIDTASPVTKQDETTFKILNNIKAKSITCHAHQLQIAEQVKVKKLVNHGTLPKRATDGSIGFDIASKQEIVVPKGTIQKYQQE